MFVNLGNFDSLLKQTCPLEETGWRVPTMVRRGFSLSSCSAKRAVVILLMMPMVVMTVVLLIMASCPIDLAVNMYRDH